jgi:tetratricopeptide (TPR) repeat protein
VEKANSMQTKIWFIIPAVILVACSGGPKTKADYEEAGKKAFLEKDYPKARDYLGKAVLMKSSDRDVLYYLGMSYERDYYLDSAIHYLKRADLLHPNDREINTAIYPIAVELKEWDLAVRAVQALIATGDSLGQYRELLADLNARSGSIGAAYLHARELWKTEPDNPDRYFQLAVLAYQVDHLDFALEVNDQAIERFGPEERFMINKGVFLVAKGEFPAAEKILRPIQASNSSPTVRLYLANALGSQEDRAKKEEAYGIYQEIRHLIGRRFKVDSLMAALEKELYPEK